MFRLIVMKEIRTKRMIKYEYVLNKYRINKGERLYSNSLDGKKIEVNTNSNVYIVKSLHEYVEFIDNLMLAYTIDSSSIYPIKYRKKFVFRGLNHLSLIKSKVYNVGLSKYLQEEKISKDALVRKNLLDLDFSHIKKFEENACLKLKGFSSAIDLLAAAEHYGCKTRYVDWSHSPLVGTLFAIHDEAKIFSQDGDEKYYCLMIRDYRNSSLILKNLLFDSSKCNHSSYLYMKYVYSIIELERIIKCRDELSNIYGEIRKHFKYDSKMVKRLKKDFYGEIDEFVYKNIIAENREKVKSLLMQIYEYFQRLYSITNISQEDKNGSAALMTRKFVAEGSKIFLETCISNERVRNQRGLFEIDIFDSIQEQFDDNCNMFLLIKDSLKKELIKYIDRMGLNYYILMDEPEQCADVINRTIGNEYSFMDKIEY